MRGMQVRNHKNSAYIQRERQRSKQCKRPSTFFSNFFLPTISNYSTRLNSAQLTNSSQLSSSYQPSNSTLVTNSSRLSSTNSQDYHLPHNKSGRGGREIFLVVAGSWLVVLDGCCALRASPSSYWASCSTRATDCARRWRWAGRSSGRWSRGRGCCPAEAGVHRSAGRSKGARENRVGRACGVGGSSGDRAERHELRFRGDLGVAKASRVSELGPSVMPAHKRRDPQVCPVPSAGTHRYARST
jgi:hypothetical protein